MKFKITGAEALGPELAEMIGEIGGAVGKGIDARIKNVALQARGQAAKWAAARLYRTKQQYQDALSIKKVGPGMWAIVLDASAVHLEDGYPSFDMKPGLLKLGGNGVNNDHLGDYNVAIGANKDGSKGGIRVSKDGYRYRAIPFDHSQSPANSEHPLNDAVVQKNQATETTMGSLAQDLKTLIKKTRINGITKDADGNPVLGKVATVRGTPGNPNSVRTTFHGPGGYSTETSLGNSLGGSPNELDFRLAGLTKYQYEEKKRDGTKRVRTAYMTFRMVSEKQTDKWIHPGFDGAKIFPDLAMWAEDALTKEIEAYLRDSG